MNLIKQFLSVIYGMLVNLRYFLYNTGILKIHKLPVKIVCVGNITAGGTGKTPCVLALVSQLIDAGKKVVILTRGYKRKTKGTIIFNNAGSYTIEQAGDEPYMIKKNLPGIPIIIGKNRYKSGLIAIEKFSPDIILLDDGFQHIQLYRDINIVLINCLDPFGKEKLLPSGYLREPAAGLIRANFIILTHTEKIKDFTLEKIKEKITSINPHAQIYNGIHQFNKITEFLTDNTVELDFFKKKTAVTMASIGHPEAFELTAKNAGLNITKKIRFADHHWYKTRELIDIFSTNDIIITTEKDAIRIELLKQNIDNSLLSRIYVLKIKFVIPEISL